MSTTCECWVGACRDVGASRDQPVPYLTTPREGPAGCPSPSPWKASPNFPLHGGVCGEGENGAPYPHPWA